MDGRRFDVMAKTLAATRSRRGVLRTLSGGALAATLSRLGLDAADAKKKPTCKKRKRIGQRCRLKNGAKCKCRGGALCKGGRCKCPAGTEQNGNRCIQPPACLENGTVCEGGVDACCSGFCTSPGPIGEVEATCCAGIEEECDKTSDCCGGGDDRKCESGRCCVAPNGFCGSPGSAQSFECCGLLTCDMANTGTCVPSIAPPP